LHWPLAGTAAEPGLANELVAIEVLASWATADPAPIDLAAGGDSVAANPFFVLALADAERHDICHVRSRLLTRYPGRRMVF
jgi:hypothetical protein